MDFKGTRGKWRKFQLPNGNMKITCDDWREFAEIEFKHWQNTEERRKQCLYNALIISKAPEMLELINEFYLMCIQKTFPTEHELEYMAEKAEKLIKESTEL